jgi:molybdate transport system permease protein
MLRALLLSLWVSSLATIAVVLAGGAAGYWLARSRRRGKRLLELLFALPLVFPPTLTGYYMILVFGRHGILGGPLYALTGFQFTFHWAGAALAAAVVSFPLMALSAHAALGGVDPDLERAGLTLGRSRAYVLARVTLPLAWKGLAAGALLAFARALGEFGATLMIAGNVTTMPLAIYRSWMSEGMEAAVPLVIAHTSLAVAVLGLALLLRDGHRWRNGADKIPA